MTRQEQTLRMTAAALVQSYTRAGCAGLNPALVLRFQHACNVHCASIGQPLVLSESGSYDAMTDRALASVTGQSFPQCVAFVATETVYVDNSMPWGAGWGGRGRRGHHGHHGHHGGHGGHPAHGGTGHGGGHHSVGAAYAWTRDDPRAQFGYGYARLDLHPSQQRSALYDRQRQEAAAALAARQRTAAFFGHSTPVGLVPNQVPDATRAPAPTPNSSGQRTAYQSSSPGSQSRRYRP